MLNENKQQNKLEEIRDKSSVFTLSELSFLKDNPNLIFLYKKTEKLVSAVYLVSNFISDSEPLKWKIRESGLNLLSLSAIQGSVRCPQNLIDQTDKNGYLPTALKLLSFLEVSYVSGLISEMNYTILKYEFELLIRAVESAKKENNSQELIFPEHFFEVLQKQEEVYTETSLNTYKGHKTMSDTMSFKKRIESLKPSEQKQKDKTNRQDIIISLLRKGGELSIKDFTSFIKDCSEKTIQRELISLVSKGQIKKMGEKRWSRYSLN